MRKIVCILSLLFLVMAGSTSAQSPVAKFMFEDAEEAFAKQDYKTTLARLDEAEKELGEINPPILFLRIMARNEILKAGASLDFDNLERLRADCNQYLKDYGGMDSVKDQAREVYKVSTTLKQYPATREAFLKEEEAKRRAEEARLEAASRQAEARLRGNMVLGKRGVLPDG